VAARRSCVDEHLEVCPDGVRVETDESGEVGDRQPVALMGREQALQLGPARTVPASRAVGAGDGHVCCVHP